MAPPVDTATTREPAPRGDRRRSGRPLASLLAAVCLVALIGIGLLVLAGPDHWPLSGLWQRTAAPAFREVVYQRPQAVLGRDLVIAPADAIPEKIEWVLLTVAGEDRSTVLRLNVFTSEAVARRRRDLIDQGIFAKSDDEDEPDPPGWAEVYPDWVGIYTRDPTNNVHQLSICLNDPGHEHCTVQRYS